MKREETFQDLDYFKLLLIDFLKESHPEKLSDKDFISARSEMGADAYEMAFKAGSPVYIAREEASKVLFEGLHFSKHDTIVNVLWEEFLDVVPQENVKELAIKLLPDLEEVFAEYELSETFAGEAEYDSLYTELTGAIDIFLSENELQ